MTKERRMKLEESIGRYPIRKVIRFAMRLSDLCATEVEIPRSP